MKTKDLFCANCQKETTHSAEIDSNGEYVFTCLNPLEVENADGGVVCGRFLKLPADVSSKEEAEELMTKHEEANMGQVSVESQEKKLDEILNLEPEPVEEIVEG